MYFNNNCHALTILRDYDVDGANVITSQSQKMFKKVLMAIFLRLFSTKLWRFYSNSDTMHVNAFRVEIPNITSQVES